jgi:glycosyltransferase involved in cell wall biosynthesis
MLRPIFRNMKVVLCANTSWYLWNFRCNLITVLQQQGHEIYAIAPHDQYSPKLQDLGAHWFHLPLHQTSKNPLQELRSFIYLFLLLRTIRPDIVLTFTIKCNLYTGLLTRLLPIIQIANISGLGEIFEHHNLLTKIICFLYRLALNSSRKVFFQNREDLQTFLDRHILPETVCEWIPGSGVDLARFTPVQTYRDQNKRIFLMFGRIVPRKGYDLFLQAAQYLKRDPQHKVEFQILGIEDRSRQDSAALLQRILACHTQGIITYIPATDDVVPILQQADVVVLPSEYHEGVPKSLLEALACGKPIITTNWKGCRDTVEHGVNGYIIERGDFLSFFKYLDYFLHADRQVLAQMGTASRQKAEQEFDENSIISRYLAIIHSIQLKNLDLAQGQE